VAQYDLAGYLGGYKDDNGFNYLKVGFQAFSSKYSCLPCCDSMKGQELIAEYLGYCDSIISIGRMVALW
jgi:hypothetical protein